MPPQPQIPAPVHLSPLPGRDAALEAGVPAPVPRAGADRPRVPRWHGKRRWCRLGAGRARRGGRGAGAGKPRPRNGRSAHWGPGRGCRRAGRAGAGARGSQPRGWLAAAPPSPPRPAGRSSPSHARGIGAAGVRLPFDPKVDGNCKGRGAKRRVWGGQGAMGHGEGWVWCGQGAMGQVWGLWGTRRGGYSVSRGLWGSRGDMVWAEGTRSRLRGLWGTESGVYVVGRGLWGGYRHYGAQGGVWGAPTGRGAPGGVSTHLVSAGPPILSGSSATLGGDGGDIHQGWGTRLPTPPNFAPTLGGTALLWGG